MKFVRTLGLIIALLFVIRLSGAQVLNTDVGIPISSAGNPGGAILIFNETAYENQPTPVGINPNWMFTSCSPGDLILYDSAAGTAPSDWYADIRFFNPSDPTGLLGMPATEAVAYYPGDVGPGGFGSFQLFPNYNMVAAGVPAGGIVLGTESLFGPVGGIPSGQLDLILFETIPTSPAGTPEPGSVLLLTSGSISLLIAYRRSRARTSRE